MKLFLILIMLVSSLFAYEGHNKWVGLFAKGDSVVYTDQKLFATLFWEDFRKEYKRAQSVFSYFCTNREDVA